MKLNIHQIMERSPYDFKILYEKDFETAEIINVRYFRSFDKITNKETLYIMNAEEETIPELSEPVHILFISQIPSEFPFTKTSSCTQLCTQNVSAEKILYTIQDVVTWFHIWEQRIYNNILNNSLLKDTLNLCAEALRNPIAVFDLQQNLLFSAGVIPQISSKSGLWDYILNHGRSPEENDIEFDIDTKLAAGRKPFYYQSKNQFYNIKRMIAPLYHKNSLFGLLALSDITQPFTQGEYLNVCQIQYYMEQAITHTKEFYFSTHHTPWYINQLLRGQAVNHEVLNYNARKIGFIADKRFFLWTFQKSNIDEKFLENLLPNIAYALDTNMVYYYANQIIVIDQSLKHYQNKPIHKKLHSLLSQNHLRFGQSMIFDNLTDLHVAFMQSQIALSQHPSSDGTYFIESYQDYILQAITDLEESDGLVYPAMNRFLEVKENYRNELLICLEKYITSGLNISATANAIFVHRHTVIYRIEKIEDILQIRLQELSENELSLILLSCKRLKSKEQ